MSNEKRKAPRLPANMFADLYSPYSGEKLGRAVVVDVSLLGIAVDSEVDLDIGNVMECHIEIPIQVKVQIVRRIAGGQMKRYGLRFKNQSIFEKFLLRKVLKGNRQTKKVSL